MKMERKLILNIAGQGLDQSGQGLHESCLPLAVESEEQGDCPVLEEEILRDRRDRMRPVTD
jgi:hypothetical protein